MIRSIIALITVCAVSTAYAGFSIDSEYPSGTNKETAFSKCSESEETFEAGVELVCPVMKEAAQKGYSIGYFGHDHGAAFTLKYNGVEVDVSKVQTEQVWFDFKLSEKWDPSWHDTGVAYGVFEFRYKEDNHTSVKQPYAIIYRDNATVTFSTENAQDWKVGTVASSLVVIQLNGAQSKVIGVIDSLKAFNAGKVANELARECADSVSGVAGQGNAASCFN